MLTYLDFYGNQTPILFGNGAFYKYEKMTGSSAIGDFFRSIPTTESGDIDVMNMKIGFLVDITYCGFVCAGAIEKKPFTALPEQVAAWIDNENMIKLITMIADSLPREKESNGGEQVPPGE